jgi:hypothetical protein
VLLVHRPERHRQDPARAGHRSVLGRAGSPGGRDYWGNFCPRVPDTPQNIPALYDDPGLRTAILATLPTLDDSGVAVRQTGGRDPLRGIRISDAPAGGPQPTGMASSANPVVAPSPLDKGKGAANSASAPGGSGGSEEERRRRLRHADGSLVSDPLEALEDCWWGRGGRLRGPRRAEARQSSGPAATTTILG